MTNTALPLLRPMRMGELLDQAIRLYRKNFFTFVGIISLVYVPVSLLPLLSSLLMYGSLEGSQQSQTSPFTTAYLAGLALTLFSIVLQLLLIQGLGTAALTRAISDNYLGQPTGVFSSYARVGGAWGNLLLALLLLGLIYIAAVLWMIVPCVGWISGPGLMVFLVMMVMPFIAPAVVVERAAGTTGLRRAWDLARRRFWWLLGYMLLLSLFAQLIVTGPSYLASYLVGLIGGDAAGYLGPTPLQTIAQTLTAIIAGVLYTPLQLTAITLAYFDLRVRTEGFDLALLTVESSGSAGVEAASQAPVMKEARPVLTWEDIGRFSLISLGVVALYLLVVSVLFFVFAALMPPM